MAVWGSGGMKRRVQLELNAPRVNWPILQSQPLECVLSDGTYPLSLSQSFSLSVSLSCCTCSPTHPLAHTLSLDAHTLTCRRTPSLSLFHSLSHLIWSLVHSSFHSLSPRSALHRLTSTNSSLFLPLLPQLLACFFSPLLAHLFLSTSSPPSFPLSPYLSLFLCL